MALDAKILAAVQAIGADIKALFARAPALSGAATVTLPGGRGVLEDTETVAALGVTPAMRVIVGLAATSDADENCPDELDLVSASGVAGVDQITFTLAFSAPTSGPIKLNWSAS
jgi:hypothetical protein